MTNLKGFWLHACSMSTLYCQTSTKLHVLSIQKVKYPVCEMESFKFTSCLYTVTVIGSAKVTASNNVSFNFADNLYYCHYL